MTKLGTIYENVKKISAIFSHFGTIITTFGGKLHVKVDYFMVEQPWILDRFDDIRVLRYEVPGFETLPLEQKILIYSLSKATEAGADIT